MDGGYGVAWGGTFGDGVVVGGLRLMGAACWCWWGGWRIIPMEMDSWERDGWGNGLDVGE